MSSIDYKELFEQYYQNKYDFNTESLVQDDIIDIKRIVREKRVDYALAPLGTGIFDWILKQNKNIRFEIVAFDSDKIDGMLYIPTVGKERACIILNKNKPLINQIFTAAHEFYHYEKDYQKFKEKPYVCDFSILNSVNEKRACRFAAELLLPEEALQREVKYFCCCINAPNLKEVDFETLASFIMVLTIKYEMPLKAIIYRMLEEHFIDSIDLYIENYEFIKKVLQKIRVFEARVRELYSNENSYVLPYSVTYQNMGRAFSTGNASKDDIINDAAKLDLDLNLINDFLDKDILEEDEQEDEKEDIELFKMINAAWRN